MIKCVIGKEDVLQTHKDRWQEDLFVACPLSELVPEDHILKRVDKVLDLSWLHDEVRACYCQDNGRASIDPESAARLMLAGFFQGVVHDRKLMREAQVNLAIRWFAGYRLDERLPDHSSLTRIRQRWGAERFKRIFEKTVQACIDGGLVSGDTVHIDASLIRADVSWESLTTKHADKVLEENCQSEDDDHSQAPRGRPRTKAPKQKKRSTSDPEATMATNNKKQRLEPSYKQHTAVDDRAGIIVDVALTTGETNEGQQLLEQIERVEANTDKTIKTVTADASYAHGANYRSLEQRATDAVIPPQPQHRTPKHIPARRFKYDAKHHIVRCPGRKKLQRKGRDQIHGGWRYSARACECNRCPLRHRCLPKTARTRTILILDGYEALLRARRRKARGWDEQTQEKYNRHRWRAEGVHGEAKTQHGLRRAVRRGLDNVAIQVYLTAAVMNLKRLAKAIADLFLPFRIPMPPHERHLIPIDAIFGHFRPTPRKTENCHAAA